MYSTSCYKERLNFEKFCISLKNQRMLRAPSIEDDGVDLVEFALLQKYVSLYKII
jgi:hypothetical protein